MIKKIFQQIFSRQLFSRCDDPMTSMEIIAWWENRRLSYNIAVGVAGILTVSVVSLGAWLCETLGGEPIGSSDPPIFMFFGMIAYGVMANVCYTGGWLTELLFRAGNKNSNASGKMLFFSGLIFSIALTMLPGVIIVIVQILEILSLCANH